MALVFSWLYSLAFFVDEFSALKNENPFYFFSAIVRHLTAFHCRIGGFKTPHTLPDSTYWTWLTGCAKYGGVRNHFFYLILKILRFYFLWLYSPVMSIFDGNIRIQLNIV